LRRIGDLPAVASDQPSQVLALGFALEVVEGRVEGQLALSVAGPPGTCRGPALERFHRMGVAEQAHALDQVAQLADVALESTLGELATERRALGVGHGRREVRDETR
jgi:hypothetical protein